MTTTVTNNQLDEITFSKAYHQLLLASSTNIEFPDDYKPNPVKSLPTSLGKFPHSKHTIEQIESQIKEKTLTINVKSIKQPKFKISLSKISINSNLISIKSQLLEQVKELNGYDLSSIKLLIKGKVINDIQILKDLNGINEDTKEISFILILSTSGHSQSQTPSPIGSPNITSVTSVTSNTSNSNELINIDESLWNDIEGLLTNKLGVENGSKVLKRLQDGYK